MSTRRAKKKSDERVTQAQALASAAFAAIVTQFPPAWIPDFLSAVEKATVHDEPLRGSERRALEQARARCLRLFDLLGLAYQEGDEVVATNLAAKGLAFLHAHLLESPTDSELLT
jgi:hypothetical protein